MSNGSSSSRTRWPAAKTSATSLGTIATTGYGVPATTATGVDDLRAQLKTTPAGPV